MSETKKPKKIKKHIVDVHEPGTSAPPATSKPVIVTNRALLRDPMVVDQAQATNEDEPKAATDQSAADTPVQSREATIKPLDDAAENHDETPVAKDASPEETAEKQDNPPPADELATTDLERPSELGATEPTEQTGPTQAEQADMPPETAPSAANEMSEDGQATDGAPKPPLAKQAEAEAVAQAKHEAEIQQLVDSKQYVLPISTTEKRKSKRFVLLGAALAVILIIVWLDIALDAGIIKLGGLKPLTHFFSN